MSRNALIATVGLAAVILHTPATALEGSTDSNPAPGPDLSREAPTLILYDATGYAGDIRRLDTPAETLAWFGFNGRASSARIESGAWEVCDGVNFTGRCEVLFEREDDLSDRGWDDAIVSARPLGARPEASLTVYSEPNFQGEVRVFVRGVDDLRDFALSAPPESLRVTGAWRVCDREALSGRCRVAASDVASLREAGARRAPMSFAPVEDEPVATGVAVVASAEGESLRIAPGQACPPSRSDGSSAFYERPQIDEIAVAACLDETVFTCGAAAATRFCRTAGFSRATGFRMEPGYGASIYSDTGRVRIGRGDRLHDVTCENELQESSGQSYVAR